MERETKTFRFNRIFLYAILALVFHAKFCENIYAQVPRPERVVIVIEENQSYNQIIGNSSAPYINSLANDTLGLLFTQSFAITHPSQPNYLWLFSGDNQGVTDDNLPSGLPFTTDNLGSELMRNGYSFKGYSEDLPSVGYNGTSSGAYARKHNPWVNWQDSPTNGIPSSLNVPFSDFPSNYVSLPSVSIVIPNLNNDMHDGTISAGDTWLKNNLDGYIQWAKANNSLFILTFDEDDGSSNNQIATIFVGQMVKGGTFANKIDHLNVLRTIEDMFGIGHAGSSADSSAIPSNYWLYTTDLNSEKKQSKIPQSFHLFQNYPNPFNPSTMIKYDLPKEGFVSLKIYNILGKEVRTLVSEYESAGTYNITFNASDLSSGIYFYRLSSGNFAQVKKLLLLK
jgi:hypothetical protein